MPILNLFQSKQLQTDLDALRKEHATLLAKFERGSQQYDQIRAEYQRQKDELDRVKRAATEAGTLQPLQLQEQIARLSQQRKQAAEQFESDQRKFTTAKLELDLDFEKRKQEFEKALNELDRTIKSKQQQMVVLDEEALLQEFGLYKPRYDLLNSSLYKKRMEQVIALQKKMIKEGIAASCATNWTINNDQKEGARMIKDYTKLILRAFNNECDASMVKIKFNNIEASEKRIRKAFETLNKLGERMSIAIAIEYLNRKLEELYLLYEFEMKKQEEKEEQRRIREQMREEAIVMKEIEEMKEKVEKEERHITKFIASLDDQMKGIVSEVQREMIEKERAIAEQKLAELAHTKQDVLNREQNTRAGYVYVISNIGSFGDDVFKIGVTRRLDPTERIDELGDASVPFRFDTHAMIFSDDAPALENALHKAFAHRRLNLVNLRREFFKVSLDEIESVVKTNFQKPVEFKTLAEAEQYRESLALRSTNGNQRPAQSNN